MPTFRQKIIDLLSLHAMDARELSREAGIREKEVVDHLAHIARSLASKDKRLIIQPSRCLRCGYIFADRRPPAPNPARPLPVLQIVPSAKPRIFHHIA
jgi:hypothetical protein